MGGFQQLADPYKMVPMTALAFAQKTAYRPKIVSMKNIHVPSVLLDGEEITAMKVSRLIIDQKQ